MSLRDIEFLDLIDAFEWLDRKRESGAINMFGAAPYLADAKGFGIKEARSVLSAWMETYTDEPAEDRALIASRQP